MPSSPRASTSSLLRGEEPGLRWDEGEEGPGLELQWDSVVPRLVSALPCLCSIAQVGSWSILPLRALFLEEGGRRHFPASGGCQGVPQESSVCI